MWQNIKNALLDKNIRKRILLTLGMLALFRLGSYIPLPGIDRVVFAGSVDHGGGQDLFSIISIMTGGAMQNAALFSLGIAPFINAFIIMQLLTLIIPALDRLNKQGDEGRRKVTQITRYVAIVLALVQAIGIILTWNNSNPAMFRETLGSTVLTMVIMAVIMISGSVIVMWIGERITEYGIGNGTSLLIFVGILSTMGNGIVNAFRSIAGGNTEGVWFLIGYLIIILLLFTLIVFIDLSERRITVRYAKQVKGNKMYGGQTTHIPIKVNSTGVMPIIFASSFLMFPMLIGSFWPQSAFHIWWVTYMGAGTWAYSIIMFVLIIFFAFFYSQIQFNPADVARNIQQYGGFIPGIRPGKPTSDYLSRINNRITLFGALFLGFVALIPALVFMAQPFQVMGLTNAFTATGLLIVVSVAMELNKQLEGQLAMKNYKGFLK